jgi:hypothetical protein
MNTGSAPPAPHLPPHLTRSHVLLRFVRRRRIRPGRVDAKEDVQAGPVERRHRQSHPGAHFRRPTLRDPLLEQERPYIRHFATEDHEQRRGAD